MSEEEVAVKPPPKKLRKIDPGNEILEKLIEECEANLPKMSDYLFREKGIKARTSEISRWIRRDEGLRKLAAEIRKTRSIKRVEARKAKQMAQYHLKHPEAPYRQSANLDKETLEELIKGCGANLRLMSDSLLRKQGIKRGKDIISRWIRRDEGLRKLAAETRKQRRLERPNRRSVYPGNEILEELIKGCGANLRLMSDSLLLNHGIKLKTIRISRLILQDKELTELAAETRKARREKEARERKQRCRSAYPSKETLKELIGYCEANLRLMSAILLVNYGIKLKTIRISRLILQDKELTELAAETRKARREKEVEERKQRCLGRQKRQSQKEQAELLPAATYEEKIRLRLDGLDKRILKVYAKGKTPSEIAKELGVVLIKDVERRIETSIPGKYGLE